MFYKFVLIGTISLIYFFILPINFIFADRSYGIFNLIAVATILVLWIIPIIYFYKKRNLTYGYISVFIILNMIVCPMILFFGEKHAEKLQKELIEKVKKIQQYLDEGKIRIKQ